ncbi:MAG: HAMP domain-containing sensor histidine kinase, partial [Bacteroidota bacterium]|nr:HAMP domain-containing sensor histidine kinase [Bacteroidota bacterium]
QMPKANAESFDMGQLVKEVVALFGHHKGVRLECKDGEGITLSVFADRNHFVSVLNNLIKNAIQACEQKNSEVDVHVRLSREDKFVRVDVIDQGIGIAEVDKVNVFVPNFTTKSTGSGLGLAIARQIIENVEGSIGFVSKEGEGSTFYFLVPLQDV